MKIMKKGKFVASAMVFSILTVSAGSMFFLSCTKDEKKEGKEAENHCPVIIAALVPQAVKDSFAIRYPSTTVNTWFQKDSIGFCAYFIQSPNLKKLAEFSRTGAFILEETDNDHDGQYEDSTGHVGPKGSAGCECEIPD